MREDKPTVLRAKDALVQCQHEYVFLRERQVVMNPNSMKAARTTAVYDVFFCKFCLAYKEIPR